LSLIKHSGFRASIFRRDELITSYDKQNEKNITGEGEASVDASALKGLGLFFGIFEFFRVFQR